MDLSDATPTLPADSRKAMPPAPARLTSCDIVALMYEHRVDSHELARRLGIDVEAVSESRARPRGVWAVDDAAGVQRWARAIRGTGPLTWADVARAYLFGKGVALPDPGVDGWGAPALRAGLSGCAAPA